MVSRSHALQRDIAVSPFWTSFNTPTDGTSDAKAGLLAAATYASGQSVGGSMVDIYGGGTRFKMLTALDLSGLSNIRFRNCHFDYSSVASVSIAGRSIYAAVVGQGSLSNVATLSQPTRAGAMDCVSSAALTAGEMVMFVQNGPIATLTSSCTNSDTTISFTTTNFHPSGFLLIDSEVIAYTSKGGSSVTVRSTNGRGRKGSTAAAHSAGALVYQLNDGQWGMSGRPTPRYPVEVNYVQASRARAGGGYNTLLRHSFDRIFSSTLGGVIKKITPLSRIEFVDCTFTGSAGEGRASGVEYQYYFRYGDHIEITNCRGTNASDAHGVLDTCFNSRVWFGDLSGKANSSTYDGHYGVTINNGCHWTTVGGIKAQNLYKAVHLGAGAAAAAQNDLGFPRWINLEFVQLLGGGLPWDNSHEMIELNSWVEHVTITSPTGIDAQGGISHEGGRDINFIGGSLSRWNLYGLTCDGVQALKGFKVRGISVNDRTLGAAGTTLDTTVNSSVTTIVLANNNWLTDVNNDFTAQAIKIDSEIIQLGQSQSDGKTFINCVRGFNATTAASHTSGADVYGMGAYSGAPLTMDLTKACNHIEDPDSHPTYLTSLINSSAVTIAVAELSVFPAATSTAPGFAEIEGETAVSGNYPSEVVSYTGKSAASGAGNLTGCVRGQRHTNAVAHAANQLIQPHVWALSDIDIEISGHADLIRTPVALTGYNPAVNFDLNAKVAYTGQETCDVEGVTIQPGGVRATGSLHNFQVGYRVYGNGVQLSGRVTHDIAQASGAAAYLDGPYPTVTGLYAEKMGLIAYIASTATKAIAHNNSGRDITNGGADGIDDSGPSSSLVNNTPV